MRGIILFVVIVTVSSVRSLHPQPQGENNRVKGGTPVSSNFDKNSLGPTKTKKGKRPSRIGNIDVNYIRTIGADIALRENAQSSDSVSVDVKQNKSSGYLSSLQKGEPPGYNKTDSYISRNNADGSNYKTNKAMLANFLNIYSTGGTQSSANIGLNNYNDGGYLSPELHPPVINRDSKPEYQSRIQPKTTSWKSIQQKNLSDKIAYQYRQEKNIDKQQKSKSKLTLNTFSDQAYDPWKPDFGIPDQKEYTKVKTNTGGVKAQSYNKVDNAKESYLSTQKDVTKHDYSKNTNHNDRKSEKQFNMKNNYQVSEKSDVTIQRNNQSPKKPSYDFGRPDRPELRKLKYSSKTTGKGSIKVAEKPDLLKPNFNRPDQSNNNGYMQPTKEVKQTVGLDVQNKIKTDEKQSLGKTNTSNDYSNKDNQNAKIVLDTFKTLYQAKFANSGYKPADLSKPDFNRPDKSYPLKEGYGQQPTYKDKPSYDFGRPDKPSYISKSDFKISQNIAYKKDINSQTITHGKSLYDLGKPDRPDQSEPRYKKLGQPDFSTPDFNRPDKPYLSKRKPDFSKPDFSTKENTRTSKKYNSEQTKVGISDINKSKNKSAIKSSIIIQEKPDFNRPEKPDITKQDYNQPQKQIKPTYDFGRPDIQDQSKPSYKESAKTVVVKPDKLDLPKPDFNKPNRLNAKQNYNQPKKQEMPSYDFGRPDKPTYIPAVVKPGMLDTPKPDINRPDNVDKSKQNYNQPQKQVRPKFDFGKPEMPDKKTPNYDSAGKTIVLKPVKTQPSKPDFNRPDQPDKTKQGNRSLKEKLKPSYDFGKPDLPGKMKPSYISNGKAFDLKPGKPDISKPDFNRPDKPDALRQGYDKQLNQDSTTYDFSNIDKSVQTQQSYQQVDNRNNIVLKPDFNRPDQPDTTVQGYGTPAKQIKPKYDFGKPDVPDQYQASYESAGKSVVLKPRKPDISKPDFNRPDKPDTKQQGYKQPQKQVKPTYDFGRQDVPDQKKPSYKSAGKTFDVKAVKPDISKPDFNRPDKPDASVTGYNKQLEIGSTSYDFSRIDKSVQTQQSYQQAVNRNNIVSKPDFNRPDQPDTTVQGYGTPAKQIKPTYDFGKPDVPDQYQASYESAGKTVVVKPGKPDISKPDFNRPDKPDTKQQGYKQPQKQVKPTYDFGRPDVPDQKKPSYISAGKTFDVKAVKPDISKPDFNRPDKPDASVKGYNNQLKIGSTSYDFSTIDKSVQTKQSYQQVDNRNNIDLKPDFNRPDQPDTTVQGYGTPAKQIKPTYDFGKPDVPDQYQASYESAGKTVVVKPGKPDISKPDFNRPDKPDTKQQGYKQPQKQVKPTYDFGRPDVPDQKKPSYISAGKTFDVKAVKPDISKPDFNRPDKPDASVKGYNNQLKIGSTSYDFSTIDKSVQTQQSYQQVDNRNNIDLKPDFNRPDQPDTTVQGYGTPAKQIKPTYDFGKPDVPDQYQASYESAGKSVVLKPGKPDISKPDFNRPDKPDTKQQGYKQPQKQVKPTYDFGRPDVPDQTKPSYISAGKSFDVKAVKPDISKPDFNRPDKPDASVTGYNEQLKIGSTSYDLSRTDKSVKTQQSYQQGDNRNNIVLKPDFNRPDQPDTTVQGYGTPAKQIKPTYDFGKPDVPDQYQASYESPGKTVVVNPRKPDISKPDFNRPDKPDTKQQGYKQPQKQVKPTYDFGRPDVPDQKKPSYISAGKTFDVKAVKPDISKPDFNRPDKPDASVTGYNEQLKIGSTSYDFSTIDKSVQTQQSYQQVDNRNNIVLKPDFNRPDQPDTTIQGYGTPAKQIKPTYDFGKPDMPDKYQANYESAGKTIVKPGKPDISKPDFNRPDKPDTKQQGYKQPQKQVKPTYDFGRPDVPDQKKPSYISAGKTFDVKAVKPDISKPDFNRPDKPDASVTGYNEQLKIGSTSYDFSTIDKSVQTQQSYQQVDNRNNIVLKPDFNRPDQPDTTIQGYGTPAKQKKPTYDFGKPDMPDKYQANYESAGKTIVKPGKPDISKPDFNRPDKPDFVKPDMPGQYQTSYESAAKTVVVNPGKPDISKPDFNRPDKPDTKQQGYKQPQKQVKPTYDFGRPDVPDQKKPSYISAGKTFDVKAVKPDISKPDFNRPDKPDASVTGYNEQLKIGSTSYDFSTIDKSVQTQQSYQQVDNRNNIVLKPDFNRPDQPDTTIQGYGTPAKQIKPTYDFGKPDMPDKYQANYESAGKTIVKPGKPDISKPDFNRPDKPDTKQQGYKQPQKQVKPTYDFGRPDVPDQKKPSYISAGKTFDVKAVKPDISKPDFNRPDKPDASVTGYNEQLKIGSTSYDFSTIDKSVQTQQSYQQVDNRNNIVLKPDFNRPDQPDTTIQGYGTPAKQKKPTYDFGKPDMPDKYQANYESAGKTIVKPGKPDISKPDFNRPDKPDFVKPDMPGQYQTSYESAAKTVVVNPGKPDISKPDFNRPDKPDTKQQGYKQPQKQVKPTYDFGRPDVPDQKKPSYISAEKTFDVKAVKPDISKPDFNRPDKPDASVKGYNKQLKQGSTSYDFSGIDKSVQTQQSYQQGDYRNNIVLKPDFNRPDQPDTTVQGYGTPAKQIKPTYDFGKPDVPDQYQANYESAWKPLVVKPGKPDISKPDFNRPDKPDTKQQGYKQPQKQVKPTYDFGRPDVPDQKKPSYISAGKIFDVKAVKPDISKPDFNRPDKPDASVKGYNNQLKIGSTSYDFSTIDKSVQTQQSYQQVDNRNNIDFKPDFNRPDQPDTKVQGYGTPAKQIKPTYDFGKPDVPDKYQANYESAGKTIVKPGKPDISKPDFNRPDKPDTKQQGYKQPQKQVKPTYDFGRPDVPDQKKPSYISAGKTFDVKAVKPDISKPDFNRPDKPDASVKRYNKQQVQGTTSYDFNRIDKSVVNQQRYQQGDNRDNIVLKPDFNRPDQPDTTVQGYGTPAKQIMPKYDFGKPDVPDQYQANFESAGKTVVVKPRKPDISKPDLNRPDKPDTKQQGYKQPQKQVKPTYDFGRPDVPDQKKPSYKSDGKTFDVKAVKPVISKPDFSRPDKPDASVKEYNRQLKLGSTSYDFSRIDKSVQTHQSYQQGENRKNIVLQKPYLSQPDFNTPDQPDITIRDYSSLTKQTKPTYDFGKPDVPEKYKPNYETAKKPIVEKHGKPDISKPDFNRPDQPDTTAQGYGSPAKQIKPIYDFGKPDVPDQYKPIYESAGKTFVVKAVKPDITKPDFNRPDKPDASTQGYNKQAKPAATSYEFSKVDQTLQTQQNYQQVENRYNLGLKKPDISKPDFNRPDQPDNAVQGYGSPAKQIKSTYDFGKPDVPDQYNPTYESAEKSFVVKAVKPDITKPDFNRPDKPDASTQGYNKQLKPAATSYEFSKVDQTLQTQQNYQQGENRYNLGLQKPDISKPDFNRPDQPDNAVPGYGSLAKQIKPTFDFGKPDVPDQNKPIYESAGKTFVVKAVKPDITKPDFNRPDKPDASTQGYNKQLKQAVNSYEFSKVDQSVQTQQSYQQGENRYNIGLQKPDISKPDFNRPDQPDTTVQSYGSPAKQIKPTYDFGKPDVPDQYKPIYESAGKSAVLKPSKPDISKPDFNRPDQPDTTVQSYGSPAKQIKPTYDFGKPDVPDQYKPTYESAGKTFVVKAVKPDITKPDFNRPDKPDASTQGYNKQAKPAATSYEFSKVDQTVKTQQNYQQGENRYNLGLQKPDLSKPDFNRPDQPDNAVPGYGSPAKQIKPTYDFGKPDVPDQNKPIYESAGKTFVVKAVKPDITKPDFNRPDKPDASTQGYNKQLKLAVNSYEFSKVDQSVQTQQSYQQGENRYNIGLRKPDILKPDFNRPDQPDTTVQSYEFGKPDVPDQYKPIYESAGKSAVLKPSKPDISKPDFNRPDQPDTTAQGYGSPANQIKPTYDFGKPDVPDQYKPIHESAGKSAVLKPSKPDISKPDFNRPDQPDTTAQGYGSPAKPIKPTFDFGKPDVPDQYKPTYESAGKTFVVKAVKPDITKPDFNRPDKPDASIQGYNKQAKPAATSYEFSKVDQTVKTQQNYQQVENRYNIGLKKPDISKPDFNRPDQPDATVQGFGSPAKQIKPTYDFGKPDVPDQYKPIYETAGKSVVLKPSKPDISKPDFNRPDKPDTNQQGYKQPQKQVKPTYDFGRPDVPDQKKPSYKSDGKTFVVKEVKPDVKPDFNRPDTPDATIQEYNKQTIPAASSYELKNIDKYVETQQSYQQGENRYNIGLQKPDKSKPDFNRPDQPDLTVQGYGSPAKQNKPAYDFRKPDVPDQYKPIYDSAEKTVIVKPSKPDISKPDFNRPDIPYTSQQDVKQPQKQIKPLYDFGRPDVPDQIKPSYESAGKSFVVKAVKPDLSKPDFNRPDKPNTSTQGYNKQSKPAANSYEFNKVDQSLQTQQSYQRGKSRYNIGSQKPDISKPDLNRPDQTDTTVHGYRSPAKQIKPAYDFGKPDVPDLIKQSYKSAGKLFVVKAVKPDTSKPDFNRPDQPDTTVQGYESLVKKIKPTYDFGKPDVPDQYKPSYESAKKPVVEKPSKPDISKPEFNRPDKPYASQQDNKQPQQQVKPTYDFGRPDVPDKMKPRYRSDGKTFVVKSVKPDISKPDFNRADKPDALTQGYNKQPKPDSTSYEIRKIDQSVQSYQQVENSFSIGLQKPDISKPDFNRPNQPDTTEQSYGSPEKQIKPTYDFGKPDVPDQYKPTFESAGKTFVVKAVKPDITKPDFNRPDKPDASTQGYNKQAKPAATSYEFSKVDQTVQTQQNYQQVENRYNIGLKKPDIPKPDFNKPDQPDNTVQGYGLPAKQIKPEYDFRKPDVPDQFKPTYESAGKPVVKPSKQDTSKPDFNRPDKPYTSQQDNKQPQIKLKPTYDFGRPSLPDQNKPSYKSAGKAFTVKAIKPDISKPDFKRPDQFVSSIQGYNKQLQQGASSYDLSKIDQSVQTQQSYQQVENRYNVGQQKIDIPKPDFNRPDIPYTSQQDYKQQQKQVKPTNDFGRPGVPDQNKPSYKSVGKIFIAKAVKPGISKPDFNRPDKHDASTQENNNVLDQAVTSYKSNINQNYNTPQKVKTSFSFGTTDISVKGKPNYKQAEKDSNRQKGGYKETSYGSVKQILSYLSDPNNTPAEKRIKLNSFKQNREPATTKTDIKRPESTQMLKKSKNEFNFQNLNQDSASLVLNALKKLRLLNSNKAKSAQQYETGEIVSNNRNIKKPIDITPNSVKSNGQESEKQTNYANWQMKQNIESKNIINNGMDAKSSSKKAADVYNSQPVKLLTKLKSGKPYFSERKDAIKQGILLKDMPIIRDSYTQDKKDNNNSPNVNGGTYSKTSQDINKSVKQVVKAKPYSSYSGTTSRPDLQATSTPLADLGSPNNKQVIDTTSGIQGKPAGQEKNNIDYNSRKSQPADVTGGSKVNCSVISPCCGDDDYTYLSECFLPPNVKKACDGFCPCPASGQPSGPATWLVPRTSSENSISKSSSFIKTPSAQPSGQMSAANEQNMPIVASQNDDTEATQGVGKQSRKVYSAAAKQSAYKSLTNNICALKCKGAKRNPVCTTTGITLNECIQKCRGAIVACDGACPCRPDMNERNSGPTMKVQAIGRGNKADNTNIAALRLLTSNSDDSTDTDGNDNVDPALKT